MTLLTGGRIPAPLHKVPWIDRGSKPRRCSAPFFLRPSPEYVLVPRKAGPEAALTYREFIERHAVRPWRL
eukprot:6333638-Amphidinium_carterae.1